VLINGTALNAEFLLHQIRTDNYVNELEWMGKEKVMYNIKEEFRNTSFKKAIPLTEIRNIYTTNIVKY
jgi:hypothetical protein